jgi:putative effector of murein hydrolase
VPVLLTGTLGAILVTSFLNEPRTTDKRARGFAAGLVAHGVGFKAMVALAEDGTVGNCRAAMVSR